MNYDARLNLDDHKLATTIRSVKPITKDWHTKRQVSCCVAADGEEDYALGVSYH